MLKKNMLVISLMILTLGLFGQSYEEEPTITAEMPYFSGCSEYANFSDEKRDCSNQRLITFISRNLAYPAAAREAGVEGTVYVRFTVDANGNVTDATVLNQVGDGCDEEALRVVQMLPRWDPGMDGLKPVAVSMNLPIQFSLKKIAPEYSERHTLNWGTLVGEQVSQSALVDNLNSEIVIRDEMGNDLDISNLLIAYKRNRSFSEAESTGEINKDMVKLVKKAKSGGALMVTATVVEDGEFLEVARVFKIVN